MINRTQLESEAFALGIDLNYTPEVAIEDIEAITREQWLEERKKGIGGSDAGAIMGVNSYSSALDIAMSKISNKKESLSPETEFRLNFGHQLEPLVLKYYGQKTGFKVYTDRHQYRHPLYPFMLADLDGIAVTEDGLRIGLEVKTYDYKQRFMWESGVYGKGGRIKNPEYAYQVQHYMAVMNLDRIDLIAACSNSADEICIITFERDMYVEKSLIDAEKKFWDNLQMGILPDQEYVSRHSYENLAEYYQPDEITEECVELSSSLFDALTQIYEKDQERSRLKKQIDDIDAEENALRLQIIHELSEKQADLGVLKIDDNNQYKVTYKSRITDTINKKKMMIEDPELYDKYKVTTLSKPSFSLSKTKIPSKKAK